MAKSKLRLDFTIEESSARKEFVDRYLAENSNTIFSNSDLETIANYILYGKDSDTNSSIVDRKEVQIKTKYTSYNKKEPESLEGLMEKPSFDERIFQTERNRYKTIKPKIEREKEADIPNIDELWTAIDYYQHIIDVNTGKEEDPNVRTLTSLELYKMKHMVIDLRRQQFYLKDSVKPTICLYKTTCAPSYYPVDNTIPWDLENSDFAIAPLGLLSSGSRRRFEHPEDPTNKEYRGQLQMPQV